MTCVLQPQRERGGREREKERERKRKQEREREWKGGGRKKTWRNVMWATKVHRRLGTTSLRMTCAISFYYGNSHTLRKKARHHHSVNAKKREAFIQRRFYTATTKRPQTSRVRDFNQTFCIQKFRDMHICSLDFKTMPWHAWFQNKIERYKIERYNDSRSIFWSTAHAFQWKHHIYFFRAIHHIDPLHRKQALTLSQCNSRDLTDSPYRNLEKCKKC